MSSLELKIAQSLTELNIPFERNVPMPIDKYPWKTARSRTTPKCDFYIPSKELYIEVKGFMTIEAMTKMMFLAKNVKNYYIFQGTELEWIMPHTIISDAQWRRDNFSQQISEINSNINWNEISITRLLTFIEIKKRTWREFTGEEL